MALQRQPPGARRETARRGAMLERQSLKALQSAEVVRYPRGALGKALRSGISNAEMLKKDTPAEHHLPGTE